MLDASKHNRADWHPEWGNKHHWTYVLQAGVVVGFGVNRDVAPPVGLPYDRKFSKLHAEVDALRRTRGLLDFSRPFDLLNVRLNRRSEQRTAAPCAGCVRVAYAFGVRSVYYTTDTGIERVYL